jgi:hypothetical protein
MRSEAVKMEFGQIFSDYLFPLESVIAPNPPYALIILSSTIYPSYKVTSVTRDNILYCYIGYCLL